MTVRITDIKKSIDIAKNSISVEEIREEISKIRNEIYAGTLMTRYPAFCRFERDIYKRILQFDWSFIKGFLSEITEMTFSLYSKNWLSTRSELSYIEFCKSPDKTNVKLRALLEESTGLISLHLYNQRDYKCDGNRLISSSYEHAFERLDSIDNLDMFFNCDCCRSISIDYDWYYACKAMFHKARPNDDFLYSEHLDIINFACFTYFTLRVINDLKPTYEKLEARLKFVKALDDEVASDLHVDGLDFDLNEKYAKRFKRVKERIDKIVKDDLKII